MYNLESQTLGRWIRRTRLAANIGIRDFAIRVKLNANTINEIEIGGEYQLFEDQFKVIAKVLNIDETKLIAKAIHENRILFI